MGCLTIAASRAGKNLKISAAQYGDSLSVEVARITGGFHIVGNRYGEHLDVSTSRIGKGLEMSCSLVCSVSELHGGDTIIIDIPNSPAGQEKYLFLNKENGFSGIVNIITKTDWYIK